MKKIYWTLLDHESWKLCLAATDAGLCYVGSPNAPFAELEAWTKKRFPASELIQADARMERYAEAIRNYLRGSRSGFDIPLDMNGTAFQQSVWRELLRIPHGTTCAYSDIADRIGRTSAVRAVGTAIGANPVLIAVPCHRVVGKNGKLTGYRGGMKAKEALLKLEGILAADS
ncbi:methylated-DNA--[protein]-cysteine S-methyltransferase [Paenibacillus sacheonensis]|uniref:methylated-DNA--[protein]-cysteine S-methyltransferase n=1 Tax=Paenibacillus sacheonensis TaxID=742054 RepID=A0A7X5BZG1_9BACL|nr:methylated-DNA--[protein]-cysteine S-methyltransferase [Paenibacillus sacheonensis]MBM7563267.1 methylated-DNA-[protein]-cysteine S-methyltransferase [Paenibacillus sacheonensis]NBC68175.1 methylated-DNA--[protein]-cysteine S-methyltransferase [Paenibacillus sacheonensis]